AHEVEVYTRRAGLAASEGVRWTSKGEADFTIESVEKAERGTKIVLHLNDDQLEFADSWRVRSVIKKYSDHIAIPVIMQKEHYGEDAENQAPEDEVVNTATALWTRPRNEITQEEYQAFYKHV